MLRYGQVQIVESSQDLTSDLLDWLGFLLAEDYVVELLTKTYGVQPNAARGRARSVVSHVRASLAFISQAVSGPKDYSYLPSYYAILNLMKVYVLFGPHHAALPNNRHHGARAANQRTPHSILTDTIEIGRRGVFGLFYETLTGGQLPSQRVTLRVDDFLGLISAVSHEYFVATGRPPQIAPFSIQVSATAGVEQCVVTLHGIQPGVRVPKNHLKLVTGFTTKRAVVNQFFSPTYPAGAAPADFGLQRHLVYRNTPKISLTCYSSKTMQFPEELPIALLFFYLSNVVRYQPELLDRIQASREWPVVATAKRHALTSFLMCFWSFIHKTSCFHMRGAI